MPRVSFSATGTADLGDASGATVGSIVLHVSGTFVGSILTKGWLRGNGLAAANAQNIAYKPMNTGTLTNPGTTAITTAGCYIVPTDGLHLVLDYTHTSGTAVIDYLPLNG